MEKFKEHLQKYLDEKTISSLIDSFNKKEQKGLFLNYLKIKDEEFLKEFPFVKPHPFVEHGYLYDKDDYNFGTSLIHELGGVYIQDPSAMIVSSLLPIDENDLILDMCSAPGGKLVQASLALQNKGQILANDLSFSRALTLLSNVERMGLDNVTVTSLDFKRIYKNIPNYFSKIILDAPCSGSGMFRKDEKMIKDWTYEKVIKNSIIQKELIDMAIYMLKEGGILIYSTCSYSYEEDEEIVEYALNNHKDIHLININNNIKGYRDPSYKETIHLFPSINDGEGQYIAMFRKDGVLANKRLEPQLITKENKSKGGKRVIETYKVNHLFKDEIMKYAIRPGTFVSTTYDGKNDLKYEHHYARTQLFGKNCLNISREDTLKFIKGEPIKVDLDLEHIFPAYNGLTIGYMSNKKGVSKNYYPKGLRKIIN